MHHMFNEGNTCKYIIFLVTDEDFESKICTNCIKGPIFVKEYFGNVCYNNTCDRSMLIISLV